MLTKWILGNFKAVADKTTINLAPLTVLAGANSSGKSTILQSILLLSQTLRASASQQSLIMNGEYVRLGYLADVVHAGLDDSPLEIGFCLQPYKHHGDPYSGDENNEEEISLIMQQGMKNIGGDAPSTNELLSLYMKKGGHHIELEKIKERRFTLVDLNKYQESAVSPELKIEIEQGHFDYAVRSMNLPSLVTRDKPANVHVSIKHFTPNQFIISYDWIIDAVINAFKILAEACSRNSKELLERLNDLPTALYYLKGDPGRMLILEIDKALRPKSRTSTVSGIDNAKHMAIGKLNMANSLQYWAESLILDNPPVYLTEFSKLFRSKSSSIRTQANRSRDPKNIGLRVRNIPAFLDNINQEITDFFTNNIYYLGPLRIDPQFIYGLPSYPEITHVGLKGEFTASVLEYFKGEKIKFPVPPSLVEKNKITDRAPLIYALKVWLEHMGLLENVKTTDRGKMGTEISVRADGVNRELDLTSIGIGVSQILPTLVMGLIAPKGTTFLLEQPELHLHPKVQSILADFLFGLTKVGKQCIVETHSEYLINRIRRRVAEDENDTLVNDVQLYFAERKQGKSQFLSVDLNEYGAVMEWPDGFFDEGPNEAQLIMDAAINKRRERRAAVRKPGQQDS